MEIAIQSIAAPAIVMFLGLVWFAAGSILTLTFIFLFTPADQTRAGIMGQALASGVPFSLLGMASGYLTGLSREAAVGAVLPAVLTLLGGLLMYFSADDGKKMLLASTVVIYLCVALLGGVSYGTHARHSFEQHQTSFAAEVRRANKERNVLRYRRSVGLTDSRDAQDQAADQ